VHEDRPTFVRSRASAVEDAGGNEKDGAGRILLSRGARERGRREHQCEQSERGVA
jgi:hypothetical protein